jgi:hypothetical protein
VEICKIVGITRTLLGLGLCGAVMIQVRYGLQPLRRLSRMLSNIRAGRATRLEDPLPVEMAPLSGEVNALLDHNATVIERAHTQADDLAYALKTPLTVLANEAARIEDGTGDVIRQQTAPMNKRVGHHLSRQQVRVGAECYNGFVTLIVEDDGPGIPEALRTQVRHREAATAFPSFSR